MLDPQKAGDLLATCETPLIIGVRHHSPACAWALPELLQSFSPDVLLIELPVELTPWIPWVAHEKTEAPVAMAGGRAGHEDLFFYPFADFSPELSALRWARSAHVEAFGIDLPLAARRPPNAPPWQLEDEQASQLVRTLCRHAGAEDSEDLWDRLVEARAAGSSAESVRRAALLAGWGMRVAELYGQGISHEDLLREAFMRQEVMSHVKAGRRVAAVIGSFHASALLPKPLLFSQLPLDHKTEKDELQTALVPYAFELLDSRSGYPAGIRDPAWQQRWFEALPNAGQLEALGADVVVEVCRQLRAGGHVAGLPDAKEAVRVALDLARLRGLPAPSRQELLEALMSTLAHGEVYGRGRAVARVLDHVMVGRKRGRVADDAPRSGLLPHVQQLLTALRLPTEHQDEPKRMRLDPLRSELDRRRQVALSRLDACGVPYANLEEGLRAESLTTVWSVQWTVSTEASIALGSVRGVTLAQAAGGALAMQKRRAQEEGQLLPAARLQLLRAMAECGLPLLLRRELDELGGALVEQASLAELVGAHALVQAIDHGHIPGCPREEMESANLGAVVAFEGDLAQLLHELLAAGVRACEGLIGSDSVADAHALLELGRLTLDREESGRFRWILRRVSQEGAPMMQGAAAAVLLSMGLVKPGETGVTLTSWLDSPQNGPRKRDLALRLRGFLTLAAPLLESNPLLLNPLTHRIEHIDDTRFLLLLSALRHGFEELSPAARSRLLAEIADRIQTLDPRGTEALIEDPIVLARWSHADVEGQAAIPAFAASACTAAHLASPGENLTAVKPNTTNTTNDNKHVITPADRWRLILGQQKRKLSGKNQRMARALDELYGAGSGEGSVGNIGGGAGQEATYPTARDWADELADLFGERVCEEVLGRAVEAGRTDALLSLDPEAVLPSVDLLQQVLSLKGGLPEGYLPRLRRIVQRVIEELVRELATRVQPAMVGLSTPRPTRRPHGPLDLRRTINANLRGAQFDDEGQPWLVPERLIFKTRGRRSFDWRIVLLVDVSGSMEPSLIYSAMMSAILAGLPATKVNFVTFSTEVIDLSEHASDPLALLLEVEVGGGTHIAKALRYGRQLVTVPNRTLLLLVSDFEEGWPIGAMLDEVRELVQSGVHALGLAALDDTGKARYNQGVAEQLVAAGMPVAALTPLELARWVAEKIQGGGR
ncbi:MAG: VWA domain-containing protein [Deltaproteobacteria bacterium]|nr:VWA domain-containing protein [Deltaproteobacteria bacterium]